MEACLRRFCGVQDDVEISGPSKWFLLAVWVESVLLGSLAVAILADPSNRDESVVYGALSLLSVVFWVYLATHAVTTESRTEFWAASLLSVLFSIFIFWEYFLNPTGLGEVWFRLRLVVVIVRGVFQLGHLVGFVFVDREFGWISYKVVGTDVGIQSLFSFLRATHSLLKIDIFSFALLLILARYFLLDAASLEFISGLVATVFAVIFAVVGYYSLTYEHRVGTWLFLLAMLPQPAYVGYRLFDLITHRSSLPHNVTLVQFCCIGGVFLATRATLLYTSIHLFLHFGSGLKQKIITYHRRKRAGGGGLHATAETARLSHEESLFDAAFSEISSAHLSPQQPSTQTSHIETTHRTQAFY